MLEILASPLVVIIIVGSYLIGSLSSAILLCRLMGLPDPRTQGSGNPGATNVLRFGGKKLAAAVLIIDVLKGILPVAVAIMLGLDPVVIALVALAAFLGHLFPLFFGFKGGKGVATALGGFIALSPVMAAAVLLSWLVVFLLSKISSLSAIIAASLAPIYSLWLIDNVMVRWVVLVMALLLIGRHHSNITRLLAGEETQSKHNKEG